MMLSNELRNRRTQQLLERYVTDLFDLRIGKGRWRFSGPMPAALSEHKAPTYSSLDLAGILEVPIQHADLPSVEITALVVLPANWPDELTDMPAALAFTPSARLDLPQEELNRGKEVFSDDPETGSHPVARS